MADKERTHSRKGGGRQEADRVWRPGQSGHVADTMAVTWRTYRAQGFGQTQGGHTVDKVWRGARAHKTDRHKADKVWRRSPDSRRKHGGQAPGPRHAAASPEKGAAKHIQGGHMAGKVWSGDVAKAKSSRTHGGQAPGTRPEHIVASPFSSKREPHSKLFGEHGGQAPGTRPAIFPKRELHSKLFGE